MGRSPHLWFSWSQMFSARGPVSERPADPALPALWGPVRVVPTTRFASRARPSRNHPKPFRKVMSVCRASRQTDGHVPWRQGYASVQTDICVSTVRRWIRRFEFFPLRPLIPDGRRGWRFHPIGRRRIFREPMTPATTGPVQMPIRRRTEVLYCWLSRSISFCMSNASSALASAWSGRGKEMPPATR